MAARWDQTVLLDQCVSERWLGGCGGGGGSAGQLLFITQDLLHSPGARAPAAKSLQATQVYSNLECIGCRGHLKQKWQDALWRTWPTLETDWGCYRSYRCELNYAATCSCNSCFLSCKACSDGTTALAGTPDSSHAGDWTS